MGVGEGRGSLCAIRTQLLILACDFSGQAVQSLILEYISLPVISSRVGQLVLNGCLPPHQSSLEA